MIDLILTIIFRALTVLLFIGLIVLLVGML